MMQLWKRPGHANYLASPQTKGLYALLNEAVDSDHISPELALMRAVLGAEIFDASYALSAMTTKLESYRRFHDAVESAIASRDGAGTFLRNIKNAAQQARSDTEDFDQQQARDSLVLFAFAQEVGKHLRIDGDNAVAKLEGIRTAHAKLGDKIASAPFGAYADDGEEE